ncbi:MAG: SHOCT domain-containing protein [Afipia sp.]
MGYGYGPGWGMMGGYGGFGYGLLHLVILIAVVVAIAAFVAWLVRSFAGPSSMHYAHPRRSPGLDTLEERYARGEINRDEYLQKKKDIGG